MKGADGFYYHTAPLASQAQDTLITTATQNTTKAGYTLRVQVLASGIQTTPVEAVQNSWGVTVDNDGNLVVTQANN